MFASDEGVASMARFYLQPTCSNQESVFNETKSKKSDDRHVQGIRYKHGLRSYLSVGVGGESGDSESLLEREATRSKVRSLLSYNIDILCEF